MRWYLPLLLIVPLWGCNANPTLKPRTDDDQKLFGAEKMVLDSFTRVKDWTGSGSPSGVEVFVEFVDRFGDRTKASGTMLFELYEYRAGFPDQRGKRLDNPWSAALISFDQQAAHWDKASGSYLFRLDDSNLSTNRSYVLMATFEPTTGGRFFARMVLQAQPPAQPQTRRGN